LTNTELLKPLATAALVTWTIASLALPAAAQVSRLEVTTRESLDNGRAIGTAGRYEVIRGRVHGELDPLDRHNRIIQDIDLAPRNARGRVEYVATFALAMPAELSRASGVLIYSVVNRGNGDVEGTPEGHIYVVSGWQGDVTPTARNQTIVVPVARKPDGSSITGPVLARFVNIASGTTTVPLRSGSGYPHAAADQRNATLTMSSAETIEGKKSGTTVVPREDWRLADCRTVPFPGTPDPERLCVRNGFRPDRLYELVYTARDPLVLGIGAAAVRDLVSFLRYQPASSSNPVAGAVSHVVAIGNSQSGNFIKTFINLGFNEDLSGRIVWDGAFPRIAARQTPLNFRFAIPGGAVDLYEPGSEGVLWWSRHGDPARGQPGEASLLDRCTASRTCPKIVEAFGSAEFWGLRMSPGLIGTDAAADIPLPANVRRYYYPGTTHGGGNGGFSGAASGTVRGCSLAANPNPQRDQTRALTAALIDWVVKGTPPPDSRYPLLARGDLVPATGAATGFPHIPGLPSIDGLVKPVIQYDFGPEFVTKDLSGVITREPPAIVKVLPAYVPRVDADGNETSGVPSVLHQAPLGTYLGWNVAAQGFFEGQICGYQGGFVPFATTAAERAATGDPRPSLEERYGTHEGYACVVRQAVRKAVAERFLLQDDAERMIAEVDQSDVLRGGGAVSPAAIARAAALCGRSAN
jgi:methyl coenzyme M reductase subunit C